MTILQFVRIQRMFKYNVLLMFKKGVINIGNVKNIVTPPPKKKTPTKPLISEIYLREETKVMFLEDINTAKQTQHGSNTNLLNKLIPEKTFYEYFKVIFSIAQLDR